MAISTGQVLSGTIQMLGSRFGGLVGLWAVYTGINLVGSILYTAIFSVGAVMAGAADSGLGGLGAGMIISTVIMYAGYILLWLAQSASLTAKASPVQDIRFAEALTNGFRACLTLGAAAVPMVVLAVVFVLLSGAMGTLAATGGASTGAGISLSMLLLVPIAIYLWLRLALIVPVAAVEGERNPIRVIKRAWELSRGNVLAIFLSSLVLAVVALALAALLILPVFGPISGEAAIPGFGTMLLVFLGFVLLSIGFSIAQSAMLAVIHGQIAGRADVDLEETFA